MSHKGLLIFDFDNTLVDTRGVGIHALDQVESFLRTMDGADRLLENKSQLFQTFERNLRERGEDKSGRVDIETWRSGLWREVAISAGEIARRPKGIVFLTNELYDNLETARLGLR